METSEALTPDEPMSPTPSSAASRTSTSSKSEPESNPPTASPTPAAESAAATPSPCAVTGATDSSPAALLAASLVRSRATFFERLSSTSRPSTSTPHMSTASSSLLRNGVTVVSAQVCPPTPRHSMALRSQPLHPLAQHPLSALPRAGGCARAGTAGFSLREDGHHTQPHQRQRQHRQARWQRLRRRQDPGSKFNEEFEDDDDDDDDDSVDTFFDKPSYTCYGAAVELSPASSYGAGKQDQQQQVVVTVVSGESLSPEGTVAPGAQTGSEALAGSAAAAAPTPCSSGYVRTLSAHFARGAGGPNRMGTAEGMDRLFDDLVTHVGALLASHPDVETQMGMVQGLSDGLLHLHALCETLGRKEDEVEHLRGVLRELTSTRAEAIRLKVQMAESLNGLQQEYYKVMRSAQLAQGTCKQHSARAAATRKQLVEVQSELLRYKRAVVTLRDRNRRLRSENEEMAARLHGLEQGRLGPEGHRSACYMALVQAQTPVLY